VSARGGAGQLRLRARRRHGARVHPRPGAVSPSSFPTPFDFKVVSPVFPPPNGIQSGFNGDYSGLTINKGADAHPIWSDTRNVNPYPQNGVVNDEDIFTDNVGLPNENALLDVGQIGHS